MQIQNDNLKIYSIATTIAMDSNQTVGEKSDYYITLEQLMKIIEELKPTEVNCSRCNDNGCPACDTESKGSKYNPEPY